MATYGGILGAYLPPFAPVMPHHYARPKLTPAQRDEVGFRRMEGATVRDLASEYNVRTEVIRDCIPKERP